MPSRSLHLTVLVTATWLTLIAPWPGVPARAADCPASIAWLPNGLTSQQRDEFHRLSEGSERLPLVIAQAMVSVDTGRPFLEDLERFGLLPDPCSDSGLPVGVTVAPTRDLGIDMLGINCAACHAGELRAGDRRIRIDGAPSHFDNEAFDTDLLESAYAALFEPELRGAFLTALSRGLARRHPLAASDGHRVARLERDLYAAVSAALGTDTSTSPVGVDPALREGRIALGLLVRRIQSLIELSRIVPIGGTAGGHGRTDAFGYARIFIFGADNRGPKSAPVSFPHLWGTASTRWLHWNANTTSALQRNIGQALGIGAIHDPATGATTVPLDNLLRLQSLVRRLRAPRWPDAMLGPIDRRRARAGARLYREHCAGCHDAGIRGDDGLIDYPVFTAARIGTDPTYLRDFAEPLPLPPVAEVPADFASQLGRLLAGIEASMAEDARGDPLVRAQLWLESLRRPTPLWRVGSGYPARPLAGIWATAPYLHNNAVPDLYSLLLPPSQRPTRFAFRPNGFDPRTVGVERDRSGRSDGAAVMDTDLEGNGNAGHEYGTGLTERERWQLVEYLKTL